MEPIESVACPVCGGELQPHIICSFCGTDITLKSLEGLEPTYKCPVCGKEANTKFICNECGSEFKYELITEKMSAVEPIKKEEKKPVAGKSRPKAENLVELKGGLTNGLTAPKKREEGLTNGLTNGLAARKREKGLTNGLKGGMVNGTGVTNGTKPKKKAVKKAKKSSKTPVAVAVLLALLLIFGAFYILMMPRESGMKIDGNFSDWKDVSTRSEFNAPRPNTLDMTKYATKLSDGRLFIYLEGRDGVHLFDSAGGRIYAFVDADNNLATGYRINGIGADYLCKVYGGGGKITAQGAYHYNINADGMAWDWTSSKPLFAAYNGNKLEMEFVPDSINNNYRIAFYTSNSLGNHEVSSVNIGEGRPSVYFETKRSTNLQEVYPLALAGTSVHLMDVEIFSTGGTVTLQSITLSISGFQDKDISLRDTFGNTVATMADNQISVNREVKNGEKVQYELWGTLPSGSNGTLISIEVGDITVSPTALVNLKTEPVKAYLGEPSHIMIDGAFGDWKTVEIDPSDNIPEHVDIREYSSANDSTSLYFYLRVQGRIMAGMLVPEKYAEGVPNPNPPVTPISKTETGEDIARVYIDTDNSEYKIEVLGKEGNIISSKLYVLYGNTWHEAPSPGISVAKDNAKMEGGISLNMLGNPTAITLRFEMSDWEGNTDVTDPTVPLSQSRSSRFAGIEPAPVPEFSEMLIPILFTIGMAVIIVRRKKQ